MKWPEKKPLTQHYDDLDNGFDTGFNYAIDDCRAALEEACSREVLSQIIADAKDSYYQGGAETYLGAEEDFITDAIRRHFELENVNGQNEDNQK